MSKSTVKFRGKIKGGEGRLRCSCEYRSGKLDKEKLGIPGKIEREKERKNKKERMRARGREKEKKK